MTFHPVLPAVILIAVALVLVTIRAVTLRAAVRDARRGHPARLLRWSGLTVAVLLLLVAGARPTLDAGDAGSVSVSSAGGSNLNVFFVVDRSVDSRVEDFGADMSRMAGIRHDMAALVGQYPRARFAVISFSSRASLDWPLSEDVWSLEPMIAGLQSYTSASPDTTYQVSAAAASDVLRYKLAQAQFQFPSSENLVFYLGEGAGGSRAPQGSFDLGSSKVAGGAVLGYGTAAGGPIPREVVNGDLVYAVDTQTGGALTSGIDEAALRAIADQLGVPYFHRENGQSIGPVITAVNAREKPGSLAAASHVARPVELYWMFGLAAAALMLLEVWLTIRQLLRNRLLRADIQADVEK